MGGQFGIVSVVFRGSCRANLYPVNCKESWMVGVCVADDGCNGTCDKRKIGDCGYGPETRVKVSGIGVALWSRVGYLGWEETWSCDCARIASLC